ncbi:MAG: flavodoxin family protein [Thermoplasmatales archaeon]|nr:flavodoxin family protein [Thermoplasmatales archaeon]
MKVCIIYDSKYGNGKKCIDYISELIGKKHKVEIFSADEVKPQNIEADLYIFSSPTHIGSPTRKIKKILKKISKENAKYALMTTCIDEKTKSIEKMEKILSKKGMKKVADVKIKVNGIKGPLESNYKEKIEEFLKKIL